MIAALLTTVLFSISAISATQLTKVLGGVAANFWRIMLSAVLLGLLTFCVGTGFGGAALFTFFWSGVLGFGIGDSALYQALPRLGSRLSVLLVHCLAAPFGAFVEWLWLGTVLDFWQLMFGGLTLTGVALALAPGHQKPESIREWRKGILFGVIAGLGQGGGAVLSRKAYAIAATTGQDVSGITAAFERIWGGVIVAALAYGLWRWHSSTVVESSKKTDRAGGFRSVAPWLILNSITGPVLGVACYQHALRSIPIGVVLPVVALTPLVILPFSMKLEGERPTPRSLLGALLAVGGVFGLLWVRGKLIAGG